MCKEHKGMQDVNEKCLSTLTNLLNNCHLKHIYCLLNAYDPTMEVDKCRKNVAYISNFIQNKYCSYPERNNQCPESWPVSSNLCQSNHKFPLIIMHWQMFFPLLRLNHHIHWTNYQQIQSFSRRSLPTYIWVFLECRISISSYRKSQNASINILDIPS